MPPFGRLAAMIVSGEDRSAVDVQARAIGRAAHALLPSHRPPAGTVTVLGPAEAPIALLRGRHRSRLLVMAPRSFDVQNFVRAVLSAAPKLRGSLRVEVDVDPQSFL